MNLAGALDFIGFSCLIFQTSPSAFLCGQVLILTRCLAFGKSRANPALCEVPDARTNFLQEHDPDTYLQEVRHLRALKQRRTIPSYRNSVSLLV